MSCAPSSTYTGQNYCDKGSTFGKPTALIFALSTHTETYDNFLLEATWNTAINAEEVFPVKNMKNFEDNSTEAQYYDYPDGTRVLVEQGNYRFTAWFDLNECTKKQLLNFRGFTEGLYLVYGDVIRGRSTDVSKTIPDNVKPIRINQCNVEKATLPGMDGTPEMIKVTIDLTDEKDINEFDVSRNMNKISSSWDVYDLDGLTVVTMTETGTSTDSSISVLINANCGGTSKPISGIYVDDDTSFTVGARSLTGVTESSEVPGKYTIASSAAFVNGDIITLISPVTRKDDVFVIADGTITATIGS